MRRYRKSLWTNGLLSFAVSSAIGLAASFFFTAIFSAFTFYLMDSMEFSSFFSIFSLASGAFSGGYICGRFRRRKGLQEGMLCGLIMYIILGLAGIILAGGLPGIKKLLILTLFCAAGGVTGVNSKRPKSLTND